jgi:hypothetical protein
MAKANKPETIRAAVLRDCYRDGIRIPAGSVVELSAAEYADLFKSGAVNNSPEQIAHFEASSQ